MPPYYAEEHPSWINSSFPLQIYLLNAELADFLGLPFQETRWFLQGAALGRANSMQLNIVAGKKQELCNSKVAQQIASSSQPH